MKSFVDKSSNNVDTSNIFIQSNLLEWKKEFFSLDLDLTSDIMKREQRFLTYKKSTCQCDILYCGQYAILHSALHLEEAVTDEFCSRGDVLHISFLRKGFSQILAKQRFVHTIDLGMVFFQTRDDTVDTIFMPAGQEIEYTSIMIRRSFLREILSDSFISKETLFYQSLSHSDAFKFTAKGIAVTPLLSILFESFYQPISDPRQHRVYMELKLKELMVLLAEECAQHKALSTVQAPIAAKLRIVKAWLMVNFAREFTLKTLVREFGLNEFILKKDFKELYGYTIRQFTIKLRMEEARRLLYGDNISVNMLASRVGYKSVSHFVQAYKAYFGETPGVDR